MNHNLSSAGILAFLLTGNAEAADVTISGLIKNDEGADICALVLANGKDMFSCNPYGRYRLTVPVDSAGEVTLFVWADSHKPYKAILDGQNSIHDVEIEIDKSGYVDTDNGARVTSGFWNDGSGGRLVLEADGGWEYREDRLNAIADAFGEWFLNENTITFIGEINPIIVADVPIVCFGEVEDLPTDSLRQMPMCCTKYPGSTLPNFNSEDYWFHEPTD